MTSGRETLTFIIPPGEPVCLAVDGETRLFPVGRVFCIGRNYADHAIEMGGDPEREEPFFFAKPASAIIPGGGSLPYPPATTSLHHEVELVVALVSGGRDLSRSAAREAIFGHAVGIDLTRRDLQDIAKRSGRPWDMAKGFDASGPVGALVPAARREPREDASITLDVNGERRQSGTLGQMIWKPDESLAWLSSLVELKPGDLVFTGTPAGIGAIVRGDRIAARITGLPALHCTIV